MKNLEDTQEDVKGRSVLARRHYSISTRELVYCFYWVSENLVPFLSGHSLQRGLEEIIKVWVFSTFVFFFLWESAVFSISSNVATWISCQLPCYEISRIAGWNIVNTFWTISFSVSIVSHLPGSVAGTEDIAVNKTANNLSPPVEREL